MNGRERLITVLGGGIPDRVPVSPFVQEDFLSWYYPGESVDRVKSAVRCAEAFDFDILTRHRLFYDYPHFLTKSRDNWEIESHRTWKGDHFLEEYRIRTPLKTLRLLEARPRTRTLTGPLPTTLEYMINDEDDLEAFIRYVPDIDDETVNEMERFALWSRALIGDRGLSAPWGLSVYNLAARLRKPEDVIVGPLLEEDLYHTYMDKLADISAAYNAVLARCNGDVISLQGNMANAGIFSKAHFDQFILPYEKRVITAIHAAGSFTIYHNCGMASSFLESYADLGISAWETVAGPPQGDNTLADAKRRVGRDMTLIGNLDQIDFLKTASPDEIRDAVAVLMAEGKPGGRYIFSCSDFLETGTPEANVRAMIEAARQFGQY